MANLPEQSIMITPGMFETRTVRSVRTHTPNRFAESGHGGCADETGTISLLGKSCGVQTAYWGDAEVWELVGSGPTHPHCDKCGAPLYIGMEMIWRCGYCN